MRATINGFQETGRKSGKLGPSLQIESPVQRIDDDRPLNATAERDNIAAEQMAAKGPLSGMVPGGGESTTGSPAAIPGGGFGIPGGLPGGGLGAVTDDKGGGTPTLVFGGFSMMLVPMRGMSMSNMASMFSTGQQLGQMVPKPGGS